MISSRIKIKVNCTLSCRVLARNFARSLSYTTRPSTCVSKFSVTPDSIAIRPSQPTRFYASQVSDREEHHERENCGDESPLQEMDTKESENNVEVKIIPEMELVQEVPWYLRVESPEKLVQPIPERQRIPNLPEFSPPILEPLMNHISIDLGLDYLSLLDLRKLEPPPALGANLLMLIATARSERHLHVSADRLCRWLRSEYKLRPDADGLLGRNELKTRLKRKANRAKLMARNSDNTDDGIRSGWICVDVGNVECGELVTKEEISPRSFTGFGQRKNGVRIVAQLLTAEKREEIELEKLWNNILKKGSPLEEPEQFDEDGQLSKKTYSEAQGLRNTNNYNSFSTNR
ncbi:ATPase synthesis protein 25, mitochondrial [Erysiphe neolycopersici]|uniref:ATPase synthesis protein 25 n=1 Tax=Erysiphe neolycopersici TaxID=212602 RepID=A0A420HH68_9PEZI|nr:ATPase synthesis protein 25, mitochondrial [Erysiphe neolycopersici]